MIICYWYNDSVLAYLCYHWQLVVSRSSASYWAKSYEGSLLVALSGLYWDKSRREGLRGRGRMRWDFWEPSGGGSATAPSTTGHSSRPQMEIINGGASLRWDTLPVVKWLQCSWIFLKWFISTTRLNVHTKEPDVVTFEQGFSCLSLYLLQAFRGFF